MHLIIAAAEEVGSVDLGPILVGFLKDIGGAVTGAVPITVIILAITTLITLGLGHQVVWEWARKGFKSLVSVLTGRKLKF